jgi:hypothetical protein
LEKKGKRKDKNLLMLNIKKFIIPVIFALHFGSFLKIFASLATKAKKTKNVLKNAGGRIER